jgi:hypothetical protein
MGLSHLRFLRMGGWLAQEGNGGVQLGNEPLVLAAVGDENVVEAFVVGLKSRPPTTRATSRGDDDLKSVCPEWGRFGAHDRHSAESADDAQSHSVLRKPFSNCCGAVVIHFGEVDHLALVCGVVLRPRENEDCRRRRQRCQHDCEWSRMSSYRVHWLSYRATDSSVDHSNGDACGRAAAGYGEVVCAWGRSLRVIYLGFSILIYAGLPVILFAPRLGVFLMLAGVVGMFATRLGVGIVGYRQTMRRPWPKVPSIEEDDDDW